MARATTAMREKARVRFELIEIDRVRAHEELQAALLARVTEDIRAEGVVKKPILVAEESFVILDGHHRFAALRALGCRRVPAFVVDYFSDAVEVGLWPTARVTSVTKDEVIARGRAGRLYSPKTTRHRMKVGLPDRPTSLDELL